MLNFDGGGGSLSDENGSSSFVVLTVGTGGEGVVVNDPVGVVEVDGCSVLGGLGVGKG